MSQKQNPLDLGLFASGIALVVGSFSPWISISIMNISGIEGWRGYLTLISGLILLVNASTKLWPRLLDVRFTSKISLLSKVSLVASLAVLVEVAVRLQQVSNEFSDVSAEGESTVTTDPLLGDFAKAIDEFTKSLTDALKPRLAIGWYICLVSVAVSAAFIFVKRSKTDDVDVDTQPAGA
jgi:hypothetical protein